MNYYSKTYYTAYKIYHNLTYIKYQLIKAKVNCDYKIIL